MPKGPGKYDDLATYVREQARAHGVVVIVLDGKLGNGFSVQADPFTMLTLPEMLEHAAKVIREDMNKVKQ